MFFAREKWLSVTLSELAYLQPLSMSKGLLRRVTVFEQRFRASVKKTPSLPNVTEIWQFVTLFVTFSRRAYGNIRGEQRNTSPEKSRVLLGF
jgi:hypothetical protein